LFLPDYFNSHDCSWIALVLILQRL
jgi:hypothetical protein